MTEEAIQAEPDDMTTTSPHPAYPDFAGFVRSLGLSEAESAAAIAVAQSMWQAMTTAMMPAVVGGTVTPDRWEHVMQSGVAILLRGMQLAEDRK